MSISKSLAFFKSPAGRAWLKSEKFQSCFVRKTLRQRVRIILSHSPCRMKISNFQFQNTVSTVPYYHFQRSKHQIKPFTLEEISAIEQKQAGIQKYKKTTMHEQQLWQTIQKNKQQITKFIQRKTGHKVVSLKEEIKKLQLMKQEQFRQFTK